LEGVGFKDAVLKDADLQGAILTNVNFRGVDMSNTKLTSIVIDEYN